jgi:rSAM/selenodomain-associated transferase 2/rSAM/selenodomain-associated transferase 1
MTRPTRPAGPPPDWRPAVLIMAKAPVPGTVKTRLHPLLGLDGCARLQRELIRHATATAIAASPESTRRPGRAAAGKAVDAVTTAGGLTVFLAVAPPEAASDVSALAPAGVRMLGQRGAGLGERLTHAVADVFAAGHRPVVVIGTDAPTLTPELLTQAFGCLADGRDIVFGPARDGGYYLAGLNLPAPELFALDPGLWGTGTVLTASLAAARRAGLTTGQLPALRDLDTPDDARGLLAEPALPDNIARALRPPPSVSIVVPTLNEAAVIDTALTRLRRDFPACELIVADGGSSDATAELAARHANVVCCEPGRAAQMNAGAACATGEVLWFIHADTRVDPAALGQISSALENPAVVGGGLRMCFDQPGLALAYVACTSNLRARWLHWVFGDQAMFIRRHVFDALGGFPSLPIMEDLEMSRRLHRRGRLAVLPATATTSARRFTAHGTWRTLAFMQYLKLLYFTGTDPQQISDRYRAGPGLGRSLERKRS